MSKPIGINIGFDQIKVAANGITYSAETVIAEYQPGVISLRESNGIRLVTDGQTLNIGRNALTYGLNPHHPQDNEWVDSPYFKAMFQAGLGLACQESESVRVVLSLPVNIYRQHKDKVLQLFTVPHKFQFNDRAPQVVTVEKLSIIPDGIAAIFGMAFDNHGNIINFDLLTGRTGVVDVGSKQVSLADVIRGADVPHKTKAIEGGCWTIAADVATALQKRLGRDLTEYESRDILHTPKLKHRGTVEDCRVEVEHANRKFARRLISEIHKLWPDWMGMDNILLTGGGVNLIGRDLLDAFPHAEIVKNPVFGNALGLYNYAEYLEREQEGLQ